MSSCPIPVGPANKHHALVELAEALHDWRQKQPFEIGNIIADTSCDQPQIAHLLQDIHAKPPAHAVHLTRVRKVGTAVSSKIAAILFAHHRPQQPIHLVVVDRLTGRVAAARP